jgi:hypothetical protein
LSPWNKYVGAPKPEHTSNSKQVHMQCRFWSIAISVAGMTPVAYQR